jgi:hypothetical protein
MKPLSRSRTAILSDVEIEGAPSALKDDTPRSSARTLVVIAPQSR